MKLRSLAVNQFKKFTTPTKLEGIEDGLNIVVGPNEMGKSTLLDALRAVLFEKYDSKAGFIKKLQNERNQAGPVAELEFELENGTYTISKRFMKRPYARLRCPDGVLLEGHSAETALRELLHFSEPGKTGGSPETLGMWNVLWVKQGQSFGAIDIPRSARANLHGALESEVGTVLGGRRGRELPQIIEGGLRELLTKTGKPTGKYKTAINRVGDIKKEIEELEEKKRDLSDTLLELEGDQGKLKRLSDSGRGEADRAELDGARERRNELARLESRIGTAERELEVRKLKLQQAEQIKKERHELRENVNREKKTLEDLRRKREEVLEREKQARANLEKLKTEKDKAETEARDADDNLSMRSRVLAAVETKTRISELSSRLDKARDAEKRQMDARQRATAVSVTEETVGRVESAEKDMEDAVNRLNATSTLIAFEMEDPSGIEVNGSLLNSGEDSLQAVSTTVITIPQRGRILIEPAVENRDDLLERRAKAENRLKDILGEIGVSTVKEAQTLYDDRMKALSDEEFARREAELYAPRTNEHEAGAQALADYVTGLQRTLENNTDRIDTRSLPERQKAEAMLDKAADEAEVARHALGKARTALDAPEKAFENLGKELASTEAKCEESENRMNNLLERLGKAESECAEDRLSEKTEAARAAVTEQEASVAELRAKLGGDDTLEQAEARVERLEKAAEERRKKQQNLEINIERLRERIRVLEGAGVDEDIEQKKRELELRERERGRHERESQVLGLLLKTLRDAEREAKELYLSPVTDRMKPYLQRLFPGSDIRIDEDLDIKGVIRENGYEERFSLLSMGTQEQIAVLVRLAFAEMLIKQGRPATVVLDDALVFSDDARMERMFDILTLASRRVQLLIFTCREQLFENVGGHTLSLQPGDPEELMSA